MPILLDCNFTVAVTDTAGFGLTGLVGPYVQNVYMHTSATPAVGSPNPASGTIVVQLTDNYNLFYSGYHSIISPTSGSAVKIDNSAMTAGVAYQISTLGDASVSKWHTIGVPAGITPAVGITFIALSNGGSANVSTSRVMAAAATGSGVASIELFGPVSPMLSPAPSAAQGYGGQLIFQCHDYAGALVAPADGTLISLSFYLSNSSVLIQGE